MLSRTSSQICGRWYLPMFLLRDGLLALINKASFMVLVRFWSSLPSMEKLSIVTSWPEVLWWSYMGDGALRCSFNLSSKFLADSPIYSSSQSTLSHLNLYMTPLFFVDWVFVFWWYKVVFDGLTTFQVNINPILLANVFIALTESLMVWNHNVRFWANGTTGTSLIVVVAFLLCLSGCSSQFDSVDGPVWIITST